MIWLIILQLRSGALKLERGRFGVCFLFFSWLITFWQIQCKPTILHSLTQFVAFKPMQLLLSVPTNMDIFANVDLCSYSAPGGIKYSKKSSNLRELRIIPPPTLIYQKKKKREKVNKVQPRRWWNLQYLSIKYCLVQGWGQPETGSEKAQTASIHVKPISVRVNANTVNCFVTKWDIRRSKITFVLSMHC